MTYNISLKTLERSVHLLDELKGSNIVEYEADNPHMAAYTLREAMHSAKHFKIEPYCNYDYSFSFKQETGIVTAKPRKSSSIRIRRQYTPSEDAQIVYEATSEIEVVAYAGAMTDLQQMQFPNYHGPTERIERWCAANLFEISARDPLTLIQIHAD